MMTKKYDVVVIGSGPAGGHVAARCQSEGLQVALIESRGFGGTCPLRGCNPKKVLVGVAEIVAKANALSGHGIRSQCSLDWEQVMEFKRSFVEDVPEKIEDALRKKGVHTYHGRARFVDERRIQVGDGEAPLEGSFIAICTGAEPLKLGFEGEDLAIDSEQFLELKELPNSVLFIGGGYISLEFAHLAAIAGARVQIVEAGDHILSPFDQEVVAVLQEASQKLGVQIATNRTVQSIESRDGHFILECDDEAHSRFSTDLVVHGAGRIPNLSQLNLGAAGIQYSDQGIEVNSHMQSVSHGHIYAAGDAAATPYPLTPTAALEAEIVVRNIVNGPQRQVDHTGIPSVVFTFPPLAAVGMTEEEAKRKGISFRKKTLDLSDSFTNRRLAQHYAAAKLLVESETGNILGAVLFGENAEEAINVFAMAMRCAIRLDELGEVVWTYPSEIYKLKHLIEALLYG